jgi:Glycosyl transferase family 21
MGKASAINEYLPQVRERIIVLCCADLIPEADALERLVAPFADPEVGLATSHPVPVNDPGRFMRFAGHVLWRLHHKINLTGFESGEMITLPKIFERIPYHTAVDEASIEPVVRGQAYQAQYVGAAVVYNKGPETLADFFAPAPQVTWPCAIPWVIQSPGSLFWVDHAHQISPSHRWPGPDLRHVRPPDLIRLSGFHAAHSLRRRCASEGCWCALADSRRLVSPQRPLRSVHRIVGRPGCLAASSGSTARPTDGQGRGHQRGRVSRCHQLPRLEVNYATAHSPRTFLRISFSNDLRPRVRSSCRMRRSFSVSAAAVLLPPKCCHRSLLGFILLAVEQIRSDPVTC